MKILVKQGPTYVATLEIRRIVATTKARVFQLNKQHDGSWTLIYNHHMIPDLTALRGITFSRAGDHVLAVCEGVGPTIKIVRRIDYKTAKPYFHLEYATECGEYVLYIGGLWARGITSLEMEH